MNQPSKLNLSTMTVLGFESGSWCVCVCSMNDFTALTTYSFHIPDKCSLGKTGDSHSPLGVNKSIYVFVYHYNHCECLGNCQWGFLAFCWCIPGQSQNSLTFKKGQVKRDANTFSNNISHSFMILTSCYINVVMIFVK